ncbi:GTA-gp10 family protein [Sphingobium yanoikuyae]|uniref:GTA-gp10 family protein n=1 Tax=Sphingobium yanoikuyae TaxID=13690 RepID=UPI0028A8DDB1|nr:GTA-gp10 family protein [Sphingobium yanoikuyae]
MPKLTYLPAQPFADGIYRFELGRAELLELETGFNEERLRMVGVTPRPIMETFSSIMAGRMPTADGGTVGNPFIARASTQDIANIVRLGLRGGGMDASEAAKLVEKHSPPHQPLSYLWDIAAALVYAYLVGIDEADNG